MAQGYNCNPVLGYGRLLNDVEYAIRTGWVMAVAPQETLNLLKDIRSTAQLVIIWKGSFNHHIRLF